MERTSIRSQWGCAARLWLLSGWVGLLAQSPVAETPAGAPEAGGPTGLSVEQALGLRTVTNPQLGDDFVAFTLVVPRPIADGPGGSYLHLGVIDGLSKLVPGTLPPVQWLVSGKDSAVSMQVRPRHREVSFLRARDGAMQLMVLPIGGGDAVPFATTASIASYRWRPDGAAIAFTALEPMPAMRQAARDRGFQPTVVDEEARHLSLWMVAGDGAPRQLTRDVTVFACEWSPDGQLLACACAPQNTVDDEMMLQRLRVLAAADGSERCRIDNPGKLGAFAWSPAGDKIAFVTATDRNDPHAGTLALAEVASGKWQLLPSRERESMIADVKWVEEQPEFLAHLGISSHVGGGESDPFYTTMNRHLLREQVTAFARAKGRLVRVVGTGKHPPELFLDGFGRLTDSNPQLASIALGEQSIEVVPARDGLRIEGLLIKPVGFVQGRKYPFVIVVHGGPEAHFSDGWLTSYANWGQLLAARGYVSWYPNYRSSTGYGTAFAKHDHGDPMGKEFLDHLDAIAHFDRQELIDRDRVGIGGGSYGGYTAAWAATRHSEHFAAAVSFVPFVDLRTKWLTSDIPREFYFVHYQEQWPWQQPGLMADRSPLSWAERCRTPLLLLGGTADPRVHVSQPFMLYRAVKFATDTPVRYVQYPGEGHGNRSNVYQLDYALRTLQWFDHYLQGPEAGRQRPLPPRDLDYPR
ncbi:MAG: prolyl oligopeptidase family serine peptidase [Planctomycetes bacterium]|jgi:dipeptidyl aminopeptidase/acylaminoacyl peptidase|nr:prolyl oligopeptidase family serine peptidase [Planctomycetota bacterium]